MAKTERVTRSGYRYGIVPVEELVPEEGIGDSFTWTCRIKGCGLLIQGGRRALGEHMRVIHPDYREMGWFAP